MFNTFIMPELDAQTKWFDKSLYHFDGIEQIRHLDSLLGLSELDAIQWTDVAGQPSPLDYIDILKRIQKAGKKLILHAKDMETLRGYLTSLSSKGLLLSFSASSEDEAKAAVELTAKLTHD
jgi:hypothetical protein